METPFNRPPLAMFQLFLSAVSSTDLPENSHSGVKSREFSIPAIWIRGSVNVFVENVACVSPYFVGSRNVLTAVALTSPLSALANG